MEHFKQCRIKVLTTDNSQMHYVVHDCPSFHMDSLHLNVVVIYSMEQEAEGLDHHQHTH